MKSNPPKKAPTAVLTKITAQVKRMVSRRLGQVTFLSSTLVSCK